MENKPVITGAFALVAACGIAAMTLSGCGSDNTATNAQRLGKVDTAWNAFGNHGVVVDAYEDPKIDGITIYVSKAETGGITGSLGLAEDASNASIAVRQTGPIKVKEKFDASDKVFSESRSAFFKELHITRMHDTERDTFVYLVTSDKLIDGSPKNSISVIVPETFDGIEPDLSILTGEKPANQINAKQPKMGL